MVDVSVYKAFMRKSAIEARLISPLGALTDLTRLYLSSNNSATSPR
jgi:hypothetical protein